MSLSYSLNRLASAIDRITDWGGRLVSWLTLAMMLITCLVVVMRYLLESSSTALQESITYLHAMVFLLASAYTLKRGGHVRVDIFYRRMSAKQQALVDALGGLLMLLPLCVVIFLLCFDYVIASWGIRESSSEPGGLPFVYLLKSLLLIMPATLALQAVAEIIKNTLFFLGKGGSHTAPEEGLV